MSSYEQMVNVTISLETSPISRASFGIPLFIGAHAYFPERVRVYNSITAVGNDFPTFSDEYKAAQSAFSGDPKIRQIKIARREVDSIHIVPEVSTAAGQLYTVSVTGTDNVTVAASVTTTGGEGQATIAASLATALAGVTGVTANAAGNTLTITKIGTGEMTLSNLRRVSVSATVTEAPALTLQEIEQVDNDWYFVAAHDHTSAYVQSMAAAIEAREKQYFVCIQDQDAIGPIADPFTDTLGILNSDGYLRSYGWFHDEADDIFPEMAYIAAGAVFDPGKGVWANQKIEGAGGAARDPATGRLLTQTQKNNLTQRKASFVELTAGVNVTNSQAGIAAGNEWADVVRNRDFLKARITEQYQFFMINQPVVPYTQPGIDRLESVLATELNRYVETEKQPHILRKDNPFQIRFPKARDISALTKATRIFSGEFDGYLAGAIQITNITGTLSYGEQ